MLFDLLPKKMTAMALTGGIIAAVLPLVTVGGCDASSRHQSKEATNAPRADHDAVAEPAAASESPDVIAALQAAQVDLKFDDRRLVTVCDVRGSELTDAILDLVAQLARPTQLLADRGGLSESGWQRLSQIATITHLDLRGVTMTNHDLQVLASGLPGLRVLRLNGENGACQVDDAGLSALANCKALKVLALDHLWVGREGLMHLRALPDLAELYVAGTLVDDDAMEVVPHLGTLRKLRLAQTSVSATGLAQLTSLELQELDLSECSQVDDRAMGPVGQLSTLKRLNLWRDPITDEGVKALAGLTQLEWLNLDNTQITDHALVYLQGMQHLHFLHLGSTAVSDAGMPQLYGLKELQDLKVTRTAVTEQGVAGVEAAIPGIRVQLKYIAGQ
ncbi:MAG: hypothetical protein KatS3mg111_0875 [Pirellulaceae bacterium]|nr:MAG: hypothetical protein KatS3mg111_0875 [Pirellulaceae bacterium]